MTAYEVRRFEDADWSAVLDLMRLSLGWRDGDPNEALFQWKHRDNPFGPSPAWVAVEAGQVIGFRTFMRWEFEDAGRVVRAVRAVDTATHPQHQGRGIFKRLTLHAVDELREEGVEVVFNTPNDQSRPGYLKMGWQVVGRLPVVFRPRSLARVPALARARGPAALLSDRCDADEDAVSALAGDEVATLLAHVPPAPGLTTRRSPAYLRWRFGLGALHYRVAHVGRRLDEGAVVFRLRRRQAAVEAAICEVLVPHGTTGSRAVRGALSRSGADFAVGLRPVPGLLSLPRQGPLLTCLPLAEGRRLDWDRARLTLGDIELF